MTNVAVVGAGIIGVLTAYQLARQGYTVTVYEAEPHPAMKCSYANGGQISVCNAQTWNTWENVLKGLKWMTDPSAPLLVRAAPSIDKLRWLAGFLYHTARGSHEQNTADTIKLGLASSAEYDRITKSELLEYDQAKAGMLHVYTSQRSFENAIGMQEFFMSNGVEWNILAPAAIKERYPELSNFVGLKGGIITPSDWTGDVHKFCIDLVSVCKLNYGVVFNFNHKIELSPEFLKQYHHIVLCNGHQITEMSRELGDDLNIYPVKGYSITIENAGNAPAVSLLDDDKKIVSSKLGNRLRVAGTAELDGTNLDIRQNRIQPLLDWVHLNFPQVDTSSYSPWACLRPMSSNMMPIIKQSRVGRIWYHGGHGHLGWTLGAGTSKVLANMIKEYDQ